MLTEAEAKTKWCPFARVMLFSPTEAHNAGVNRDGSNCNCLASGCSAWRWRTQQWDPDEQIQQPGGGSYTTQKAPAPRGYCGLAGRPPGAME